MKTYVYSEPGNSPDTQPIVDYYRTEDQIIAEYWDYWCGRMRKVGKEDMISRERCIEDWITVHWAMEVTNG